MVDRCCQTCDVSAALRGTFDFAPAVAECSLCKRPQCKLHADGPEGRCPDCEKGYQAGLAWGMRREQAIIEAFLGH